MALNFKKLASNVTSKALPAAAGGAASLAVNRFIPASINSKLRGALKIAVGAILPELSPKTKMLDAFGLGMIGHAGAELANEFLPAITATAATAGVGANYEIDEDFMDANDVNGFEDETLNGTEDVMY
jgi:hypothetical protein